MLCELFPFQKQAVNEMRLRVAMALNNYRMLKIPQVVSLQAPTGSGKTIIMSALIEDIFYGSEQFTEQPEAIFVWLSDSPQLNEQSKQKMTAHCINEQDIQSISPIFLPRYKNV